MDARQTTIFTAILIGSILVGIILLYFIITILRQQRKSRDLYRAKIQAEISTLENERKRIAADLHDDFGPILASIKMKLSSIEAHDPDDMKTLDEVQKNIYEMMSRMKEISNDLLPSILLRKGLVYALDVSIGERNRRNGFTINFIHDDIPDLPEDISVNLYRIIQEVIHNTVKHARASTLGIELRMVKNKLLVMTEDNGTGFDYKAEAENHSGFGLRNLHSRTEILKGNMYISSGTGKGVKYTFEIPVS